MADQTEDVVIVGAGPVGLALAIGLARRGIRSVVLESKSELSEHSKAVLVSTRTLEILNEWGLFETFKENSQFIEEISAYDAATNEEAISVDFGFLRTISACAGACVLPQERTEHLLFTACIDSGLVDVRFGHSASAFDSDDSCANVRVQSLGGQYVIQTKFICGCDGSHSTIRDGLGFKLEGKTYDAHAILADVLIEDERDQLPWPRIDFHTGALCGILRFAPNHWRLIYAQKGERGAKEPEPGFIRERVEGLLGSGPMKIVWSSAFKIHCRNAPHFRVGRVLLLGDAAHLNSPAGGQGMNAGIHDAHNLAWKLALTLKIGDVERLLNSYDAERYDAITRSVDIATDRLTKIGINSPDWFRLFALRLGRWARRFKNTGALMARAAGMLNLRYDESELIDKSGGRLLPDLPLGDGVRLRSLLGSDGGVVEVLQNGAKVSFGDNTFDLSGPATDEIVKVGGPFLAIRPDHVIAYAGSDRDRAERYVAIWKTI